MIPDFQKFWHKQHHLSLLEPVHKNKMLHNSKNYETSAPMKHKQTASLQLPISSFKLPVLKYLPFCLPEVLKSINLFIFEKSLHSVRKHVTQIHRHYSCQSSLQAKVLWNVEARMKTQGRITKKADNGINAISPSGHLLQYRQSQQ